MANPDQPISNLPLLTEPERHRLLIEWNLTDADFDIARCVHHLFEKQADETPSATAVECGEQNVSYRELNQRANRLAHYLQSAGVGPEARVGLYCERSLEMVVAVIGVLKAGGAYVLLDPTYPRERLAFIRADAGLQVVLTQSSLDTDHPVRFDEDSTCVEIDGPFHVEVEHNPISAVEPDNLAYVLYTSGSSGKPKGVAMPHRPLVNLLEWHRHDPAFSQPARTLQFTTLSFDVSFQEIFTVLCTGGTLILIDETTRRDPEALIRFSSQANIERLFLPFVALQHLAETANRSGKLPTSLAQIVTAGEQLVVTPAIAALCRRLDCTLHNHFGPTEAHVVTTHTLTGPTSMRTRID